MVLHSIVLLRNKYKFILEKIISHEKEELMISKQNFESLLQISIQLGILWISSKTRIERPKFSVIKLITGYFYSNDNSKASDNEESITPTDIINALIDRDLEDEEILMMLDNLWITQSFKSNSLTKVSLKGKIEFCNLLLGLFESISEGEIKVRMPTIA